MKCRTSPYRRHRFPPEIIQHAVWLYYRFNLSHRDIEDLLARRGIVVTHESVRLWCNKFGPRYARRLRRGHRGYGDTVFMDEVFVRIRGQYRYLWRAVDQDGEVVDVLLQERRDAASARRFFRHLLSRLGGEPRTIVTDRLGSYAVARRELLPGAAHDTRQYANNRAELSHQATRGPRAWNEKVQIHASGATVRLRPRHRLKPLQPGPSFGGGGSLPGTTSERLCVMGPGGRSLTAIRQSEAAAAGS